MGLLDVNVLVALVWDAHVHHERAAEWFDSLSDPWATCPITEAGFIRVSTNPKIITGAIGISDARDVLRDLRALGTPRFLPTMCPQLTRTFPRSAVTGR